MIKIIIQLMLWKLQSKLVLHNIMQEENNPETLAPTLLEFC